jgi:hypothetical protein
VQGICVSISCMHVLRINQCSLFCASWVSGLGFSHGCLLGHVVDSTSGESGGQLWDRGSLSECKDSGIYNPRHCTDYRPKGSSHSLQEGHSWLQAATRGARGSLSHTARGGTSTSFLFPEFNCFSNSRTCHLLHNYTALKQFTVWVSLKQILAVLPVLWACSLTHI